MIRKIREFYRQYKEYVRVDLLMYAVLLIMIIGYVIISAIISS